MAIQTINISDVVRTTGLTKFNANFVDLDTRKANLTGGNTLSWDQNLLSWVYRVQSNTAWGGRYIAEETWTWGVNNPWYMLFNEWAFKWGIFYDEAWDYVWLFWTSIAWVIKNWKWWFNKLDPQRSVDIWGDMLFCEQVVEPFYWPRFSLIDNSFAYRWRDASGNIMFELHGNKNAIVHPGTIFNKPIKTDSTTWKDFKIWSRYEMSWTLHANKGHQVQFIWGDLAWNEEVSWASDWGWWLIFWPGPNPYIELSGLETYLWRQWWNVFIEWDTWFYKRGTASATVGANECAYKLQNPASGAIWSMRLNSAWNLVFEYFNGASWSVVKTLTTVWGWS